MNLVFLHGLPGVGKLTVARELEALTGYRVFHNHLTVDLVSSVFDFGTRPFRELREEIWLTVIRRALAERLEGLVFTLAFERTVGEDFVGRVVGEVEAAGGRVMFVSLRCEREAHRGRVGAPSRLAHGKLTSLELFDELSASGALFTRERIGRDDLTLDNTRLPPAEAAREIARHFGLREGAA
ncbi:MAG TPA: AAA family ATPase [Pyrinomonadaceae bacterium]|nr:AAA family ATPase [Pyrinomonadaceae bacterium]